jgi:type IV secretory pathway protease TraF
VIKNFFADHKGYVMPYTAMLITLVAMPMLILASDIVRSLYVNVHIQTAVDAACTSAVQAVDVAHFISTGELLINSSNAASYAQREFSATVAQSDIEKYNPVLTAVNVVDNTTVECYASAQMVWTMPGVAPLTFNVLSAAEAEARR